MRQANDAEENNALVVLESQKKNYVQETVITNPTLKGIATGKSTPNPKGKGTQVAAVEKTTNPNGNGTREACIKERTKDWVHRSFGPSKEVLNVTLNPSCQDIPSQTLEESPKGIESTRVNKNGGSIWSDEVQSMDDQYDANSSTRNNEQMGNIQEVHADAGCPNATVNPSLQKTRVENSKGAKKHQSIPLARVDKGSL